MFVKTVVRKDREVVVPRGYQAKDFLDEWGMENQEEGALLRSKDEKFKREAEERELIEERKMEHRRYRKAVREAAEAKRQQRSGTKTA